MKNRYNNDNCGCTYSVQRMGDIFLDIEISSDNGVDIGSLDFNLSFYVYGNPEILRINKSKLFASDGRLYAILNESHFANGWLFCDVTMSNGVNASVNTGVLVGSCGCVEGQSQNLGQTGGEGYRIEIKRVSSIPGIPETHPLSEGVSVSSNRTWVVNGVDTGYCASPLVKVIGNKLHYSYDNVRWVECSDNIAHWFRVEGNKLQISSDKESWTDVSDYISSYIRFVPSGIDTSSIGKLQISKDKVNWEDLSPDFTNHVKIVDYVSSEDALPKNAALGTIYGVGADANEGYRLYTYTSKGWVDNGKFTSIIAGIVQETGDNANLVMSQKVVTEELAKLNDLLNGSDSSQTIYAEGGGTPSKAWTKLLSNVAVVPPIKVIAETDIVYSGTSNSTFVSLDSVPAGDAVQSNTLVTPVQGTPGQVIAKGTVIFDYSGFSFTEPRDIYIGVRYSGTIRAEIQGEFIEGLLESVSKNTSAIASNEERLSRNESETAANKAAIEEIARKFDGGDNSQTFIVDGAGTTNKSWTKILTNVTEVGAVKIVAETDVKYTGTSESTFISYAYAATGSTATPTPIIESQRGIGLVFSKGTVIISHPGTALPYACDIYIGARFSGRLKVVYAGEDTLGIEEQVRTNTERIANNSARIEALEGGLNTGDGVIGLYQNQIQKARQLGYRSSKSEGIYPIKPLAFMHISDTHTSKPNARAIQVLNYLGANGFVKFLMHTGDILEDPKRNPPAWSNIVSAAQYPVFVTSGNHDVGNWASSPSQYKTDSQFHSFFVAPQLGSWNLKSDGGGTPNPSGKNYYFTDFTEEKIRFIVVYEYEISSVESQQDAGRGARWISQAQTDWFINSLLTTPQGYGVIVAKHAPDGLIGHDKNPFNSLFKDGENTQQTYQYKDGAAYTAFFADIVQAFVDRASVSYVVAQSAASYQGSLNVDANFNGVASGAEFICFVSGHVHADNISRLETHPKLLELNINCDNTIADNQRSEMRLVEGTTFEDAINVYGIDRNLGVVNVLRIGADYDAVGNRKDMVTIKYRD